MNQQDLLTESYNFVLPKQLIAQLPPKTRTQSKLFVYNREKNEVNHLMFNEIINLLDDNFCIVFNNTKVEPRRINCKKPTGGIIPILITYYADNIIKAIPYKRINNTTLLLPTNTKLKIIHYDRQTQEYSFEGNFTSAEIQNIISTYGLPPLPPYIKRHPEDTRFKLDFERYQTVYAQKNGSLAAPTAGFHFDNEIILKLQQKGVKILYITLHIGISTFKPVKTGTIIDHKIFPEKAEVSKEVAQEINNCIAEGKKILCVGTTTIRTLEFLATKYNKIVEYNGFVDLYIYPGYKFKITSAILTNFHLPKSTNLILISAFVGREKLLELYKIAIEKKYKFYSYGDAMLVI
ncbi:MAG: tRNA preQ1(34) S-adenosylmethionine ribosyltransferase-isomerase QueA [Endomicrobia bacterium]|nr:tRNA preQ1(34) S-adenosylmethionine ribosyltransferase-isomerase QueA [Endomicrobiia bacterium]